MDVRWTWTWSIWRSESSTPQEKDIRSYVKETKRLQEVQGTRWNRPRWKDAKKLSKMKLLCSTVIIWCLQAETTGECGQQSRNQGFMPHWKTPVHSRSQPWTTCKQCPPKRIFTDGKTPVWTEDQYRMKESPPEREMMRRKTLVQATKKASSPLSSMPGTRTEEVLTEKVRWHQRS